MIPCNLLSKILVLIVLGLGGYIVYDKIIVPRQNTGTITINTDDKKDTKEKSLIKDSSQKIVYDNEKYSNKNYEGIKVPVINIDSEDASKLNGEIEGFVNEYKHDGFNEYMYPKYDYYENDDILSINVTIITEGSSRYYKTANINTKTCKKVSNSELVSKKEFKENEVPYKVFDIYEKEAEKNGSLDSYKQLTMAGDEFTSVYQGTKNYITKITLDEFGMYLNKNGELCVITKVYMIAGPESNYYIFNLNTNSYEAN